MLEPYQPKFQQQHRPSCPLVEIAGPIGLQHRTFSKFNINCLDMDSQYPGSTPRGLLRPRQNSVFVGSSATMVTLQANPPRKTKSAMDIQTLVLSECGPGFSGSLVPLNQDRPSCSRLDPVHVTIV